MNGEYCRTNSLIRQVGGTLYSGSKNKNVITQIFKEQLQLISIYPEIGSGFMLAVSAKICVISGSKGINLPVYAR